MVKAGIVGGTGYTGVELLRLLAQHPRVELKAITSRKEAGTPVAAMFPSLRRRVELAFTAPSIQALRGCDVVFFATPNGVAMSEARALLDSGARLVDLSADFRLKDVAEWEKWYGVKHAAPDLVRDAVYGLCELNRERIRGARLVANPGCYPTATQLGFLPLVEAGVVDLDHLIADAKSTFSRCSRNATPASPLSMSCRLAAIPIRVQCAPPTCVVSPFIARQRAGAAPTPWWCFQ